MTVSKKGSFSPLVWFAVVGLAVLIAGVIFAFLSSANSGGPETEPDPSRTKFDAPSHVSDLLSKIARLRSQVKDWQLQQTISLMCRDTEVYFEKYSSNKEQDAKLFENHLAGVEKVITKYVDVQNYQRYYDDPDKLMQRGKSAVNDFAEFVLASCKRGSRAQLMDYSVDTNILSAQRFR